MRRITLVVGLTAFAVAADRSSAMPTPVETVIAKGYIVNVDEKNSSFDVLGIDGRRSSHATPCPVLMAIRIDHGLPFRATWEDLRTISVSGRITGVVVDPSDPSLIIFDLSSR